MQACFAKLHVFMVPTAVTMRVAVQLLSNSNLGYDDNSWFTRKGFIADQDYKTICTAILAKTRGVALFLFASRSIAIRICTLTILTRLAACGAFSTASFQLLLCCLDKS